MQHGIINIVIGKPIVPWWELCCTQNPSIDELEFERNHTLFTNERVLAKILKELGVVKSISEVRRNQPKPEDLAKLGKPDLCKPLTQPDCFWLKWGRNKFWVVVGEE